MKRLLEYVESNGQYLTADVLLENWIKYLLKSNLMYIK